ALQALAPPAHLPAFAGEPRIDDLRVGVVTERAVHVIKTGDRRPRHWARIPPKKVSDTYFPEIGVRHLFSVADTVLLRVDGEPGQQLARLRPHAGGDLVRGRPLDDIGEPVRDEVDLGETEPPRRHGRRAEPQR